MGSIAQQCIQSLALGLFRAVVRGFRNLVIIMWTQSYTKCFECQFFSPFFKILASDRYRCFMGSLVNYRTLNMCTIICNLSYLTSTLKWFQLKIDSVSNVLYILIWGGRAANFMYDWKRDMCLWGTNLFKICY